MFFIIQQTLNRRLRDKIHYKEVDEISESELKRIDDFQRKYMHIVLAVFEGKIKFEFGKWYQFIKWIAEHTDFRILEESTKKKK